MAAEKMLTEASCKAAKPKNAVYYLNDGAGLRLRVRPDGSRTWVFRYKFGKPICKQASFIDNLSIMVVAITSVQLGCQCPWQRLNYPMGIDVVL